MAPISPATGALRFDDEQFDVADLVLLALAEGRWQRLEAALARGLALEREHGADPLPDRVAEQVKRFRYACRLISGKELREWLAARSLVLEDLRRHCLRTVLIEEHGREGARVSPSELAAVLYPEAIMARTLATATARLGDLAAMAAAAGTRAAAPAADVSRLLAEAAAHPAAALGDRAANLERRAGRIAGLLHAESAFVQRVATSGALARCFAEHGVDWLRVRCAELTLATEGAARESMLCLRLDGIPLAELSAQLETVTCVREHYVEDLPPQSAPVLASAAIGDPVGPFAGDSGWQVLVVDHRVAPSGDDPELLRRATAAVVERARERVKAGRVRELAAL